VKDEKLTLENIKTSIGGTIGLNGAVSEKEKYPLLI
jgi:hypothetical protein